MSIIHTIRPSDSPFVNSVTRSVTSQAGNDIILPDGRWDFIVTWLQGVPSVYLLNSPSLQASHIPYSPDQESLVITFETGSYIDTGSLLDKKGMHELRLASDNQFWFGSQLLQIPTFENADVFTDTLLRRGLLKNDVVVEAAAQGKSRAQTDRTLQRHFKHVTGMTPKRYQQIMRALRAAEMLRSGIPAIAVAFELGYSDQFHLSKSVKHVLGKTPSEIIADQS